MLQIKSTSTSSINLPTPRRRFRALLLDIIEELSSSNAFGRIEQPVGWEDYLASRDDHRTR